MKTSQCLLAEAIGTFFLCFAGIAAILSTQDPINSGAGIVGIALAHGLALSVAVNAFGGVSGAHFNPAVTVGMLVTGRIKFDGAVKYILAQLVGGTVAAWACYSFFPAAAVTSAKLGIPLPGAGNMPGMEGAWLTLPILLGVEFVLTFLLMTAIFGTAVDESLADEVRVTVIATGFSGTRPMNIRQTLSEEIAPPAIKLGDITADPTDSLTEADLPTFLRRSFPSR